MYFKRKISALVLIAAIVLCAVGSKGEKAPVDDGYQTDRYIPTVDDASAKLNEDDKPIVTEKVDVPVETHETSNSLTIIFIVVGAIVLIAGAIAVIIVIKKKKV